VKTSVIARATGLGMLAVIGLAACGGGSGSGSSPSSGGGGSAITGSGSTLQLAIQQQWTADFSDAQISYSGVGSSTGVENFTNDNSDYAGTDVPLTADQVTAANKRCNGTAVEFPVTAGGIAIIYNLPGVSSLKLDAPTIAKIFEGQITHWKDPAITALNPGVSLPSTTIAPFHRSDGSGTTDVVSEFLASQAGSAWTLGTGETLNWPSGAGTGAEGSSGVAQGVSQTAGGITYAEQSYVTGSLKAAEVKNAQGQFVAVTPTTVGQSVQTGIKVKGGSNTLTADLNFPKMAGYPLSTVSYDVACQKYSGSIGTSLRGFFTYVLGAGQQSATALQFAPLSPEIVTADKALIAGIS
jgi:phosphate transport system substrate-binding protein